MGGFGEKAFQRRLLLGRGKCPRWKAGVRSKRGTFVKNVALCRSRPDLSIRLIVFVEVPAFPVAVIRAWPVVAFPAIVTPTAIGAPAEMAAPAVMQVVIRSPAVMTAPLVVPAFNVAIDPGERCGRGIGR